MTQNVINYLSQRETVRSNRAREEETYRHNTQQEQVSWRSLVEQTRHNFATEQLTAKQQALDREKLIEQARYNRAQEQLTARSQQIAEYGNVLKKYATDVSAGISYANLAETQRHNIAALAEATRHNAVSESNQLYTTRMQEATKRELGTYSNETQRGNMWSNIGNTALKIVSTLF